MRKEAKEWGLWLPHMPKEWGGMGLGHVAMASVSAEAAQAGIGPFVLNAQAPDEGNMHTLLHWGTDEQKEKYLAAAVRGHGPLVLRDDRARGRRLRPDADPDARRTRTATSGSSTATSGSSPAPAARSSPSSSPAPRTTPTSRRPPTRRSSSTCPPTAGRSCATSRRWRGGHNHCEIRIEDLRVHDDKMLGGRGQGHLLGQSRLGPARLAHCMRWIGQAEIALDMMVDRSLNRYAHGSLLAEKQGIQWMIADSAMELYQCKLMVLHAAYKIEQRARLQERGVDGEALRRQHAVADHRPRDPGARRARLLDRHAARPTCSQQARWARFADGADEIHQMRIAQRTIAAYKDTGTEPRDRQPAALTAQVPVSSATMGAKSRALSPGIDV